mmetsp:Transcript_42218/g.132999  ORF Transcript_42218/g.132999 Transcript_42218/m.132999 type:complete len:212 (-) Transcript_42218:1450-2085(-)
MFLILFKRSRMSSLKSVSSEGLELIRLCNEPSCCTCACISTRFVRQLRYPLENNLSFSASGENRKQFTPSISSLMVEQLLQERSIAATKPPIRFMISAFSWASRQKRTLLSCTGFLGPTRSDAIKNLRILSATHGTAEEMNTISYPAAASARREATASGRNSISNLSPGFCEPDMALLSSSRRTTALRRTSLDGAGGPSSTGRTGSGGKLA